MIRRPEIALSKVIFQLQQKLVEHLVSRLGALKHRGRPLCPNVQGNPAWTYSLDGISSATGSGGEHARGLVEVTQCFCKTKRSKLGLTTALDYTVSSISFLPILLSEKGSPTHNLV